MSNQIATVSLSGTLPDKLEAAALAGFDGVEIFENDLAACDLAPRDVRRLLDDLGLIADMYQPFRDLEGWKGIDRDRAFERARRKFDLMGELGCSLMLLCSNAMAHSDPDEQRIVDDLSEFAALADSRGIRIAYEALAWSPHVQDHRHSWRIVDKVAHPAFGLALDSFHSLSRKIPVSSIMDIDAAKIFFVQLADAPLMQLDLLSWSRHYRNLPGQGDLPVTDFVAALDAIGYKGPLSLEIFNDRFRAGSANMIAREGIRAMHVLREDAAVRNGHAPSLPVRAEAGRIEFFEFAASGDEADALEAMLMSIGFAVAGQHRSKPVTLFRQGGAAIVVNRDESHFAHSYNIAHGASICATGIVVGDSASALRRAQAIGIATLPDSEETPLVGMHGPGGDLVYLIDADSVETLWASEFELIRDGASVSDTSICGYDHASAAMLPTEFLGAQSFWTTMFDLDSAPLVNVADPSGLIESRALLKEGSGLRMTINSSAAQNTLTNRYVGRSFGASIQHIALASSDIWQTAAMLADGGAELLDIPANYYDDIAARFVLDADFVERLRAHNILYDRDADGDYFQLYTRAFDRRFFFEFVQRRSGYRGFGAPNAPIRLAAQARYRVPTEFAL